MPNVNKSTCLHRVYFQDGPLDGIFIQASKSSYNSTWNCPKVLKITTNSSYNTPTLSGNAVYTDKKIEKTNDQYKLQSITHNGRVKPNNYVSSDFQPIGTYTKTYIYVWTAAPDGVADEVQPSDVEEFPDFTELDSTVLEQTATEAMDMPLTFAVYNWNPYKDKT